MPYAKPTIAVGGLIAGLRSSHITFLTVIGNETERAEADSLLAEAQDLVAAPATETKVRLGSPVDEIIEEAQQGDYDMVVIGSRVAKGILDLLLQSITRKVAKEAPSSVLVVKEDLTELKNILICTGGRQVNRTVVEAGAGLAQASNAGVKLLYVADPVPSMYAGLNGMDESLSELLQTDTPIARHLRWGAEVLDSHEVSAELLLQRGVAVNEILRVSNESPCDLLVIGAQVERTTLLDELLMSTVTPQVVDHARCSVLVVRSKH